MGDISPGETKEASIPIKAGLDLESGKIPFEIYCSEKRGYDSKKVKVLIPAARLAKPDLVIVDLRLDDGTSGLARGNGNGIPESGETIELTAFIKNQGVGNAIGVKLTGGGINPGITWEKDKAEIGTIPVGETVKAKLAFTIPRNFDAKEILSSLKVADIRGVSEVEKKIAQPFSRQAPSIQYAHKILSQGREVSSVINGEEYELELAVRNEGQLAAQGVAMSLNTGPVISIDRKRLEIGEIKAKSSLPAQRVRFSVPRTYTEGAVQVAIVVSQSEFGPVEGAISVPVSVKKPVLSYEARLLSKSGGNSIEKGEEAVLEVEVVNSGDLPAEGVDVAVSSTNELFQVGGAGTRNIGRVPARGRSETLKFPLSSRRKIAAGSAYLNVQISQKEFPAFSDRYALNVVEEGAVVIDLASEERGRAARSTGRGDASGSNAAPNIKILSPRDGDVTEEASILLAADINDRKKVDVVRVEVNGVTLPVMNEEGASRNPSSRTVRRSVALSEGSNRIVVYADNPDGATARKEIVVTRRGEEDVDTPPVTSRKNPDAVAVVIGISKYKGRDIPPVDFARRDAETVKKYLIHAMGVKETNVIEAYDDDASLSGMNKIFKGRLPAVVGPATDLFVYYSGHGVPDAKTNEPYFAPWDVETDYIRDTGYAVNGLYDQLKKLNAHSVTVVIDACFSGSSDRGMLLKGMSPLFLEVANPAVSIPNVAVFTSSTGKQVSYWDAAKRHGLFTYYFLNGLKGAADADKDGRLTTAEMGKYLSDNVPKKALALRNGSQTPQLVGDMNRVLVQY